MDVRSVEDALAETSEAVTLITHKGPLPLGNFYDISGYLSLAAKGETLGMAQLLRVLYNISVAGRVTAFLRGDLPYLPILQAMGEVLEVYPDLEKDLDRCILSEDEMSDNASSQLRTIRRSIVRQNEGVLFHRLRSVSQTSSFSFLFPRGNPLSIEKALP